MRLPRRTALIGLLSAGLTVAAGLSVDSSAWAQGATPPAQETTPPPAKSEPEAAADAAEPAPKQVALTTKQIESVIAAQKDVAAVTDKIPDSTSDEPDPKVRAQLDSVAKKYGFASYDEYSDVVDTISLVMAGFDPQTKKYVGPAAIVQQQIASVQADKSMSDEDKKAAMEDLQAAMNSTPAVQFPANIELVTTYYDKLNTALQGGE